MNNLSCACLCDRGLFKGPDSLAHGLGPVSNYQLDQLPLLLGHNLWLLHEGGRLALGRGGRCGLGLNVEVELGLQLAVFILHHALVVAAIISAGFLNKSYSRSILYD